MSKNSAKPSGAPPAEAGAELVGRKAARAQGEALNLGQREPSAPRPRERALVADVAAILEGREPQRKATPPPGDDEAEASEADASAQDEQAPRSPQPEAEGEAEGDGQAEAEGAERATPTWEEVAEALGVEPADLYAVTFPMGNGERVSLGELKDKLKDLRRFESDREAWDSRRDAWEVAQVDARRRIVAIWDSLPEGARDPRVQAAIEADHQHTAQREARLLRAALPEWANDPKVAEAEQAEMAEAMQRHGFSAAEVAAVVDHRVILAMRELAQLRRKVAEGKAQARRVREESATRPGPGAGILNGTSSAGARVKPKGRAAILAGVERALARAQR